LCCACGALVCDQSMPGSPLCSGSRHGIGLPHWDDARTDYLDGNPIVALLGVRRREAWSSPCCGGACVYSPNATTAISLSDARPVPPGGACACSRCACSPTAIVRHRSVHSWVVLPRILSAQWQICGAASMVWPLLGGAASYYLNAMATGRHSNAWSAPL
jgi:hypothetical protein